MKTLQYLLLCASAFIFVSCQDYGTKYSPDKEHEVYYKGEGVTETHAKKLTDFLITNNYFQAGREATVQIEKIKDTFNLNFVYNKDAVTGQIETAFHAFGGFASTQVFDSAPVTITLCDKYMKAFKKLGYAPPMRLNTPAE